MPGKAAKSRRTPPKKRKPYTPEPVRGRVIARHMTGQSNRQIASEEGIDRDTVGRILSNPEIAQLMAQYRSRLLLLVPKAISTYEQALDSEDERVRAGAATKLLEGLQVFPKGSAEPPPLPPNHDEKRLLMLGQIMEMMIVKHERYGVPLPPEFDGVEERVNERIKAARS
jgi:hypothetical protein